MGICTRFQALTPFQIRRERACEVFLLMRRLSDYTERERKKNPPAKNGKKVIRRPAGDNWF